MNSKKPSFPFYRHLVFFGFLCMMNLVAGQITNSTTDVRMRTYNYADTLQLDFYTIPTDTFSLKPTVILLHGGGFTAGQRNGGDEIGLSTYLAKLGFNVASVDYRLSRKGKSFGCDCDASTKIDTHIEAVADLSKAINYLAEASTTFQVDPSKFLLVGSSAGAETVLNYLFMRYDYRFKNIPYPNATILGAVSLSGAVLDAAYINTNNKLPLLFFHGVYDSIVPYETNPHRFCSTTDVGYLKLNGPKSIANRLTELDGDFKIYYDKDGGHKWASFGFQFPELISEFLEKVLNNETTMKDFEMINAPLSKN